MLRHLSNLLNTLIINLILARVAFTAEAVRRNEHPLECICDVILNALCANVAVQIKLRIFLMRCWMALFMN